MSKVSTLKRVSDDIARGDLGKARDRLHGLIKAYPVDLSIRTCLAEIYYKLQYPSMAGCYWYLEEDESEQISQSVDIFEKRCGHDPWQILCRIKFKGNPDSLESAFAREKLSCLIRDCKRKYGMYPEVKDNTREWKETKKRKLSNATAGLGCFLVVCIIAFAVVVGIRTIFGWFK